MPTKAVSVETMEVGKKGGGKHWTAAQIAARQAAAASLRRPQVELVPPEWLSSGALLIWSRVMRDTAQVDLLDNLDVDTLAMYCDAMDKYQTLSKAINNDSELNTNEDIKCLQGWSRIIATYADKLGFTPAARARLIKKRTEEPKDNFGDEFD